MTEVTAAIIHREGKVLLCQRPEGKRCGLLWEFPGGKIEPGESQSACIIRECEEELAITVQPEKLVHTVEHAYPGMTVRIYFILCSLAKGEPKEMEQQHFEWLTLSEAAQKELCPADRKMMDQAMDRLCGLLA